MNKLLATSLLVLAATMAGCAAPTMTVDNAVKAECKLGLDTPASILAAQQQKHPELALQIVQVYHSKDKATDYVVIGVTDKASLEMGFTQVLVLTVKQGCVTDQKFVSPDDAKALDNVKLYKGVDGWL